jgi:protein gp37
MGDKTGISWTNATWNAIRGCTPVSPGCQNCYAAKVAKRFSFQGGPFQGLVRINAAGERTDEWNGEITYVEDHLLDPIRWKKPRRIFVNSVSDLFHHNVSDTVIDRIFAVMALAPQHTFQVLTKRPERMRDYLSGGQDREESIQREITEITLELSDKSHKHVMDAIPGGWGGLPLKQVWLGTSVENQKYADERIPFLLQTPAAVRFISAEPLLGPITLKNILHYEERDVAVWDALTGFRGHAGGGSNGNPKLDWVIVGGESQRGSRPMSPEWARSLRDQCKAAGVAFFFKQWGDWWPNEQGNYRCSEYLRQVASDEPGEDVSYVGSKRAGDLLDGVQHHEYPEVRA